MYTNGSHHKESVGKNDAKKAPQPLHNPAKPPPTKPLLPPASSQ
jgi:hypothetical protein